MKRLISIICPVYNEEENLKAYHEAIEVNFKDSANLSYEIIFVDDGSRDNTWDLIKEICSQSKRYKALKFSKNHGSHKALAAGFQLCTGDAAGMLACDLQDPPEVIHEFIEKWLEGYKIVWGKRASRDDSPWKKFFSSLFEKLIRKYAAPKGSLFTTGSFFLADKKVVSFYRRFNEHNRITFALFAHMGFKQAQVDYHRKDRIRGSSGWNFSRMINALYDSFIAFSYAPAALLRNFSILAIVGFVPFLFYVIYLYFSGRSSNIGWVSVMLVIYFFSSLILFNLSLIIDYLIRVYLNSAERPLYFVEEEINLNNSDDD